MKHVLFIVTSTSCIGVANIKTGYEFSEVANPYLVLTKAGFTIDFASIKGGAPPEFAYNEYIVANREFRESAGFKRLNFSHKLSAIDKDAYDAIFFPGGLGPLEDMLSNKDVKDIIVNFNEKGKLIAAVCHGPVALLNIKLNNGSWLLTGKQVTCFTQEEEAIEGNVIGDSIPFILENAMIEQGAHLEKSKPFESKIVTDGNIITGQNPASAIGVAKQIISLIA